MSALPEHYITEQEYLDGERISDIKHEYVAGQVYAMTGASANHNFIVASLIGTSLQALKGKKCKVMPSDMKVSIPRKKSYFYPDVSIVCGDLWIGDQYRDVLLNPTIIFEVLSPSTEAFDRSKNLKRIAQFHRCANIFWSRNIACISNNMYAKPIINGILLLLMILMLCLN